MHIKSVQLAISQPAHSQSFFKIRISVGGKGWGIAGQKPATIAKDTSKCTPVLVSPLKIAPRRFRKYAYSCIFRYVVINRDNFELCLFTSHCFANACDFQPQNLSYDCKPTLYDCGKPTVLYFENTHIPTFLKKNLGDVDWTQTNLNSAFSHHNALQTFTSFSQKTYQYEVILFQL